MASFDTRDRMEAARFVRSLLERGYRQVSGRPRGGEIPRECFRLSRRDGKLRVVYYEPSDPNPAKRVPTPVDGAPRGAGKLCTEPGCGRPHHSRGLCARCIHRWYYWAKSEAREKSLRRSAAARARRRADAAASGRSAA
jgi:hypothetical protein